MIRKSTLAATAAAAAIALIAAMAPAASANYQDIYVTDSQGQLCDELPYGCVDTGYSGELEFRNSSNQWYATCDVDFHAELGTYGAIVADPIEFNDCVANVPWTPEIRECRSGIGHDYPSEFYSVGQVLWPQNAPATDVEIEVPICYGVGQNDYFNRVVFNPSVGPTGLLRWTQASVAGDPGSTITNAIIEDTITAGSVNIVPGTP
jgi:hypothetical protein